VSIGTKGRRKPSLGGDSESDRPTERRKRVLRASAKHHCNNTVLCSRFFIPFFCHLVSNPVGCEIFLLSVNPILHW
jgi:hypothetical protein